MNIRSTQGSQVSPSHWIEHISVESLIVLQNHGCVAFQDFKQDDNILAAYVRCMLIDNELFVPGARIVPFNAHVEEFSAHGQQIVYRFVRHVAF